jgi:hypothetical protein
MARAASQEKNPTEPGGPRLPVPVKSELERLGIDEAKWRVLAEMTFPSARTAEALVMVLEYCRARGLDPLKRPVHIVPMWSAALGREVETVWPGINEVQTTAARTGLWAGMDSPRFGPEVSRTFRGRRRSAEAWEDVELSLSFPNWCEVTVYCLPRTMASRWAWVGSRHRTAARRPGPTPVRLEPMRRMPTQGPILLYPPPTGSGEGATDTAHQALAATLGAGLSDMAGDLFQAVGDRVAGRSQPGSLRLPVARDVRPDPAAGRRLLERVQAESARLRARLHGLVQASRMDRPRIARTGPRLAHRQLHRAVLAGDRVFRRNHRRVAPNTAVHLVVDVSGSMGDAVTRSDASPARRVDLALESALALALALESIPGTSVGVTAVPGYR